MKGKHFLIRRKIRKSFLLVFFSIFCFSCFKKERSVIVGDKTIILADSLVIPIDSLTINTPRNVSFKDSILMIFNNEINTISLVDFKKKRSNVLNLSKAKNYKGERDLIGIEGGWIQNTDSIFLIGSQPDNIYLIDTSLVIKAKIPWRMGNERMGGVLIPNTFSSITPLLFHGGIFIVGFSLGEREGANNDRKSIAWINKDTIINYVSFPSEYNGKNWGGVYFRFPYSTVVDDTTILVSFPASEKIARFNIVSGKESYINLKSGVTFKCKSFTEMNANYSLNRRKDIAVHYFSQFSFREIIYNPYKKCFYRVLAQPTDNQYLNEGRLGIQKKYLLAYNMNYQLIGYGELGAEINTSIYFVTSKGIYFQNYNKIKDEDNIYFYLYSFVADMPGL